MAEFEIIVEASSPLYNGSDSARRYFLTIDYKCHRGNLFLPHLVRILAKAVRSSQLQLEPLKFIDGCDEKSSLSRVLEKWEN